MEKLKLIWLHLKDLFNNKPKGTGYEPYTASGTDFTLGAIAGKVIRFIEGHGIKEYLPTGELQNRGREKYTCTNHDTNNALEIDFKWRIKNEPESQIVKFLEIEGGIINDEVNLSDRFDAWASGTNGGNNFKRVCDSKRHNGFLFEHEWPYVDDNTEYFKTPPTALIQKARYRAEVLDIAYEFVSAANAIGALQYGAVATCGYAWPYPQNDIYPKSYNTINHAFLLFEYIVGKVKEIFDSYLDNGKTNDFTKNLAWDYILGDGVQFTISLKKNFNVILINKLRQDGYLGIQRTDAKGEVYLLTDLGLEFVDSEKNEISRHIPLVDWALEEMYRQKKVMPVSEMDYKRLIGE